MIACSTAGCNDAGKSGSAVRLIKCRECMNMFTLVAAVCTCEHHDTAETTFADYQLWILYVAPYNHFISLTDNTHTHTHNNNNSLQDLCCRVCSFEGIVVFALCRKYYCCRVILRGFSQWTAFQLLWHNRKSVGSINMLWNLAFKSK